MVPSKAFNFVLIGLLCSNVTSLAFAAPYVWNEDPINISWTQITIPTSGDTGMTLHDRTHDGVVDMIYTASGTGTATVTRQFGTQGSTVFGIVNGATGENIMGALNDYILAFEGGTGAACDALGIYRMHDVDNGSVFRSDALSGTVDATRQSTVGLINMNNRTAFMCEGAVSSAIYSQQSNATSTTSATLLYSPYAIQLGSTGATLRTYLYANELYTNGTASTTNAYYQKTSTNTNAGLSGFTLPAFLFPDPQIQLYKNGMKFTTTAPFTSTKDLLTEAQVPISVSDSMSYIVSLPPIILNPAFTSAPLYFKMNDGTTTYLGAIVSSTLYYTNYNTLVNALTTNRALQAYSTDMGSVMGSRAITTTVPTNNIDVFWHNGTTNTFASPPHTVLPSGYYYQCGSTVQRFYYPQYENVLNPFMPIPTCSGTHNTISLTIKNAPGDAALKFVGFTLYNNTNNYVYTKTYLQADNTVTMAIPQFLCGNVFIKDISVVESDWVDLGILCADGVGTRSMSYVANFPITFYSFSWGASHDYTPSGNNLQTAVRHSTTPYTYNVLIKHANGTIAQNQTFTDTSSLPDVRNFNVTTVVKPASLYVYSDSPQGSLIYSAYLGSSVSLASVAAFFHQYFSYGGFDLLSFIPIIFAAMFTRNTVGLGVVLTVVCIATISWLSLVIVPDTFIFIMAVVSVLGLVGYRLAYPN